ncbi:MAG TPA: septum site-determining protein MinC [Hyphomicrobiales bacterium]|nr:septum site-determining protein MinC [Hyphomicrobiales bacterium]
MSVTAEAVAARPNVRFRGRSFMALVLAPEPPVADWLAEFDRLLQRSPGFFVGKPVVIDVSGLPHDRPTLVDLMTELGQRNIRVLGLEGVEAFKLGADARGLPPIMNGGRDSALPEPAAASTAAPAAAPAVAANDTAPPIVAEHAPPAFMLVEDSVRSGQALYFPQGDVTVVGSVASGAEIIAGGSIHVYGTLRGRAIAGVAGNPAARIFCRKLEAELVAIDGLYRTADDIAAGLRGHAVQVRLDGDSIVVAELN